jgi:hypothetical protein
MAQANAALDAEIQRDPSARSKYDIEHITASDERVVQMDIHCGVMDAPAPASDAAPDAPLNEVLLRNVRHDDDTDDDDDGDDSDGATHAADNDDAAVAPRRAAEAKRNRIEELS